MAINDQVLGTLFQDILEDNAEAISLANAFLNRSPQIVSPTVAGLLNSFDSYGEFSGLYKIDGCEINYVEGDGDKDNNGNFKTENINFDDDKSTELFREIAEASSTFVKRVLETRSSYLPYDKNSASFFDTQLKIAQGKSSEMESFENAFMRMLGMPTDADLGSDNASLIYFSPKNMNSDKLVKKVTNKNTVIGGVDNSSSSGWSGDEYANILEERKKELSERKFNFKNICITDNEYIATMNDIINSMKSTASEPSKIKNLDQIKNEGAIAYHNPQQLFRFYYLKSIPIQDSSIYGCVIEPSKVVLKPFELNAPVSINGVKPKRSLLETIIRIRLDRISGSPGIYSSEPLDASSGLQVEASNVGTDKITEIECFLIQKLRKILFYMAEKYIHDTTDNGYNLIKGVIESGNVTEKEKENSPEQNTDVVKPAETPEQKKEREAAAAAAATAKANAERAAADAKAKLAEDIPRLEILKAREDAILFLLKDTSSSSNVGASAAAYSALDLQEGVIRTASGFDDVLSGPLYSMLSYRSKQLEKMILKKKEELIEKHPPNDDSTPPLTPDSNGLSQNPNSQKYTYIGVSKEDFIIYVIAMLSLNQDYLIGLLPQENRRNLAYTISGSIMGGNSKRKDPYGILDRLDKSPSNGGFPTVSDSVNALALIVGKLYEEYISYTKSENKDIFEKLKSATTSIKQGGSKE